MIIVFIMLDSKCFCFFSFTDHESVKVHTHFFIFFFPSLVLVLGVKRIKNKICVPHILNEAGMPSLRRGSVQHNLTGKLRKPHLTLDL